MQSATTQLQPAYVETDILSSLPTMNQDIIDSLSIHASEGNDFGARESATTVIDATGAPDESLSLSPPLKRRRPESPLYTPSQYLKEVQCLVGDMKSEIVIMRIAMERLASEVAALNAERRHATKLPGSITLRG